MSSLLDKKCVLFERTHSKVKEHVLCTANLLTAMRETACACFVVVCVCVCVRVCVSVCVGRVQVSIYR